MKNHKEKDAIARFWDKYIEKLKSYEKNPRLFRWYVKHVEDYIRQYEHHKLKTHTAATVQEYLADKGRKELAFWRYQQIVISLRVLFTEVISAEWAESFPWDGTLDAARDLEPSHGSIAKALPVSHLLPLLAKEAGVGKQVVEGNAELLKQLVNEVRVRQYSIRTEKAYLSWVVRFLAFHRSDSTDGFDASHIKKVFRRFGGESFRGRQYTKPSVKRYCFFLSSCSQSRTW